MYIIPAFLFFFFFVISYKRKGLDLGGGMAFLYFLSTALAIYLHNLPKDALDVDYTFDISFIPTFVFCFVIVMGILPFYKLNTNVKKKIKPIKNIKYFNFLGYCYIILFLGLSVFLWDDIVHGIFQQNLDDMRQDVHTGNIDNAFSRQKTFIGKLLGYGSATAAGGACYMIPFYFYSLCFTKNKKWFNYMLLLSSLSFVLMGIIIVDRSSIILWGMNFLICFFLFKPYLSESSKKELRRILFFVGGLLFLYFAAVTIARFALSEGGTSGGVIRYMGCSYLNFCNIWDNVDVNSYTTHRLFPAIDSFILHSDPTVQNYTMHNMADNRLNAFYSYIGMLYVDMGFVGAIIIPLIFSFISMLVCNRYRSKREICIKDMIYVLMLAIIPTYGVISYYYLGYPRTLNMFLMIFLMSKFKLGKAIS